ncbi:MAG: leucyl/phenylalanyl-tRNA--protein transferase [Bradymonadaceae bacterium]
MKRPTAEMLLAGYAQGIFPMAHPQEDDEIYWYAPDPRGLLPIEEFHCPDRLAQTVRQEPYDIVIDRTFNDVMQACAEPRSEDNQTTWISEGIIAAYTELHEMGFAHSVEAWDGDRLVGGLYGVALGGLFAGESMFFRETDASKICLVHLAERLDERGFGLFDVQWVNPHLEQFGAYEMPREEYEKKLRDVIEWDVSFV